MMSRMIPLIAALGLAACQQAEPADTAPAEDAAPAAVPMREAVVEPAAPVATPSTPAPRPVPPRPAAKAPEAPAPAPAKAPVIDHSGHAMSTTPPTPNQ